MNPHQQLDKTFHVSWDQFHRDSRILAWRLLGMERDWRAIVSITRGGLVPTAIICRELGLRLIDTICIASYHDYDTQGELVVLKELSDNIKKEDGKDVLVIDDLADTGQTLNMVRKMIPNAHFATIYSKPLGKPLVDTFVTEVSQDTWIYFPWDLGFAYQEPIQKSHRG